MKKRVWLILIVILLVIVVAIVFMKPGSLQELYCTHNPVYCAIRGY